MSETVLDKLKKILGNSRDSSEVGKPASIPQPEKITLATPTAQAKPLTVNDMRPTGSPIKATGTVEKLVQ